MSEVEARYVHQGYWVNLEQGPVMGQTITTDTRTGAFIIALLAILSAIGLKHLWGLCTFALHQFRADGSPASGLFHQQQALLRTSPTPSTFMAESTHLWYTWRRTNRRALAETSLLMLLAFVFTIGSLAASIFSSYVVSTSNLEVLVSSPACGFVTEDSAETYHERVNPLAESYADECYGNNASVPSRCNIFTRPNIHLNREIVPCPFNESMCASPAVAFDSGIVDVNDAFGLNLAPNNRVGYRKRTTCSILPREGYTVVVNATEIPTKILGRDTLPDEKYELYCYGTVKGYAPGMNCTFGQSLTGTLFKGGYGVSSIKKYQFIDGGYFSPIPELRRSDADVLLKTIESFPIEYPNPVDDPMFSAHVELHRVNQGGPVTRYVPDSPGIVVGCALQYQHCFQTASEKHHCSELSGLDRAISNETWQGANDLHRAVAQLLVASAMIVDIGLIQTFKLMGRFKSLALIEKVPDDQWITELQYWESMTWAANQIIVADYAIGPVVRDPSPGKLIVPPSNAAEKLLCNSQKMRRSGGFVNINVFGMVFTIVVASIFTLLDIFLLNSLIALKKSKKSPRLDRWVQDGVFQLQRKAYEARGEGIWTGLAKGIPHTTENTKLLDLPIESTPHAYPLAWQKPTAAINEDGQGTPSQDAQSNAVSENNETLRRNQGNEEPQTPPNLHSRLTGFTLR